MEVFWRNGYEGTSIDDIETATGVKRGSLYNAYGSKDDLFLLALDRYAHTIEAPLLASLDEDDIGSALLSCLDMQLQNLESDAQPASCFIANSLAEASCLEGRVGSALRERLQASEDAVYQRLERARSEGQLKPDADLRALARYIIGIIRIVPLTARAMPESAAAQDVAATALDAVLGQYLTD